MSKSGSDFLDLQTDVIEMSASEFAEKYPHINEAQRELLRQSFETDSPYVYPGSDPQGEL